MMYARAVAPQWERAVWLREDKSNYGEQPPKKEVPKVGRFIDFKSDVGFKLLLGRTSCEGRLKSLLNALDDVVQKADDLSYPNTLINGATSSNRNVAYDVLGKDGLGRSYIVEMQKKSQIYYIDRAAFYRSVFIADAAPKGNWDFNLAPLTLICFLNFVLREDDVDYIHSAREFFIKDKKPTNDKRLTIFIELPKFSKTLNELVIDEDKWLFLIKNLDQLDGIPSQFDNDLFRPIFQDAEFINLNKKDKMTYTAEQMKRWDDYANSQAAIEDRKAEERAKGRLEGRAEESAVKIREFVMSLLKNTDHSMEEVAKIANAPLLLVKQIMQSLEL